MFSKKRINFNSAGWFLLPYFLVYFIFFFLPAISILPMSFTEWSIIGTPKFVGLANFKSIFSNRFFVQALSNTFIYTILVTVILTVLGLLLAVLLNQKLRGRVIVRTIVIMPYVISSAVAGILWKWMFERNFGIINTYFQQMGLPLIGWLSDPQIALFSIIIVNIWWSVGFNTVTFLAAIQGIPEELYQAAQVDGASPFQCFRYITIPQLKPIILYVTVLCAANSFQMFDEAYVITQGGPLGSTTTLVFQIYTEAFKSFRLGYSAALSVITCAIIILITLLQMRINKGKDA
ncbi:MAG: sugar ABC transporter permease [Anaerolineaceae bacterium]|jgi:ABC-type sugar transport system permease subunit|nr:MAG: sugar ABC transporter permease [Anaerolineaceae bacterium]